MLQPAKFADLCFAICSSAADSLDYSVLVCHFESISGHM